MTQCQILVSSDSPFVASPRINGKFLMSGETAEFIALRALVDRPLHDVGSVAIATVNHHLDIYDSSLRGRRSAPSCEPNLRSDVSLFDMVAEKILDNITDNIEDLREISSLPTDVLRRVMWRWDMIPYDIWCIARAAGYTGEKELKNPEEDEVEVPQNEDLDEL